MRAQLDPISVQRLIQMQKLQNTGLVTHPVQRVPLPRSARPMIRAQAILMPRLEKSSSCNKPDPRVTRVALGAGIGVRDLIHMDILSFLHLRMDVISVLQKTLHDRILDRFVFGKWAPVSGGLPPVYRPLFLRSGKFLSQIQKGGLSGEGTIDVGDDALQLGPETMNPVNGLTQDWRYPIVPVPPEDEPDAPNNLDARLHVKLEVIGNNSAVVGTIRVPKGSKETEIIGADFDTIVFDGTKTPKKSGDDNWDGTLYVVSVVDSINASLQFIVDFFMSFGGSHGVVSKTG